jgi:hypothetical protein
VGGGRHEVRHVARRPDVRERGRRSPG